MPADSIQAYVDSMMCQRPSCKQNTMHGDFYVIGGRQRAPQFRRPEWNLFYQAVILYVDPSRGIIKQVAQHVSPPDACPWNDQPSILFKASTRVEDRLYACTSTEVIIYSLPDFTQLHYLSHPYFNDIHHVTINECGDLIIVNTGLDMVLVMSVSGEIFAEYNVCDVPTWKRFSKTIDYRKVPTTKPHKAHPNYAFFVDQHLWVTRCDDKDAICLTERSNSIQLGMYPHDGVVRDGKVYFTTVDGRIMIFDAVSKTMEKCIDLNEISMKNKALGWCRGIEVVAPGVLVVGFTKLRRTKFHEKVLWVKERWHGDALLCEPTRIAAYDVTRQALLWETQLDCESVGLDAIFAIHNAQ